MVSPLASRLLRLFPYRPAFAFAYGSRVKAQANVPAPSSEDMLDLILVVDDPLEFHSRNLTVNRSHYSSLKWLGPQAIARFQENWGAKVYFNTLVRVRLPPLESPPDSSDQGEQDGNKSRWTPAARGQEDGESLLIKYGVIRTQDLVNDLLDWESLYLAGRLHKPVDVLSHPDSGPLASALEMNLRSAIHAALLLLEESFGEESLFRTIASLSYAGDVRMLVGGENRNKVANIVSGQVAAFRKMYQPILRTESMGKMICWNESSRSFVQDLHPPVILHHLNLLPKEVQARLHARWLKTSGRRTSATDLEDVMQHLSRSYAVAEEVRLAVRDIVLSSSLRQTLKGIPMAGACKSLAYARRKVSKMIAGRKAPAAGTHAGEDGGGPKGHKEADSKK